MKNPLRAWLRAHLDRPLDDVYGRIDEHGVDDAGRRPAPAADDGLAPARARHHRPRHHRGAGWIAH